MSNSSNPIDEMINSTGDGSGLQLPPAFVVVNPKKQRKYKANNASSVDGRTKGAKNLLDRINRRKKMKEQVEENLIVEKQSETERAQKQIAQKKKLGRSKDLQRKRDEAKKKMQSKTSEMDLLMKARLSDFKNKAGEQQKKLKQNNSFEMEGEMMMENTRTMDAMDVALEVATSELNPSGETSFAKIQFSNGDTQNLDNFSAKRIAACYAQLDDTQQQQFRYMLNKDAASYQTALDFAVRNV